MINSIRSSRLRRRCRAPIWILALLSRSFAPAAADRLPEPDRPTPIPAFARMYRTGCSTCHTAAPKLNVLGEVFRLNGYRMPESELLERQDEPVTLGAEPWRDVWPRAIWPGDLPGQFPLALRIQSDARLTRDERSVAPFSYRFPHELYLLAGAPLGKSMGVFVEATWGPESGFDVEQAKINFQNLWPGSPRGAPDLWLGKLDPFLFTFADRQTDRAARQRFAWQDFDLAGLGIENTAGGGGLTTPNQVRLGSTQPAIELSGLVGSRVYWGLGLAQGSGTGGTDANGAKDLYYKLRYKLGGLDLAGDYDEGGGPVPGSGGQLLDRSVTVEHFGYFGNDSTASAASGGHRAFGLAFRVLEGRLDGGAGWVWHRYDRPWAGLQDGDVTTRSVFGKLEYLIYPFVLASFKAERFRVEVPASLGAAGFVPTSGNASRVMPGLIVLIRQNVRAVAEAELFVADEESAHAGIRKPHTLWLRLDLAF